MKEKQIVMPARTIFFDESGFTGRDLLNSEQPYFIVTSSDLENELANQILSTSFPRYEGNEFKFSKIWSRPRNRSGLIRFAELLGQNSARFYAYHIDKRFCVLTKMVDFLIEPVFHDGGYDFYANRFATRVCNEIHFHLMYFCEPDLYDTLIRMYQNFVRDPTSEKLSHLQISLNIMAESTPPEINQYLKIMAIGAHNFLRYYNIEIFDDSFEIQLTTVLASIGYWRQHLKDDFLIIHDHSSNFFRDQTLWSAITSNDVSNRLHPVSDGTFVPFPLRVTNTVPGNSIDYPGIQICDILSGLISRHLRSDEDSPDRSFLNEVIEAGLSRIRQNGIHPALEFTEGPPQRLKGPDAVDLMTDIIFGR